MKNSIILWCGLAVVIVLAIALSLYFVTPGGAGKPVAAGSLAVPVGSTDQVMGPATAKVTLVEYSDFECPACGAYYPVVERLLAEFPNDLKLVYRHFPLPQHQGAIPAALAAEAAARQGKFWEMYRIIFDNQAAWTGKDNVNQIFRGYAQNIGLDMSKFDLDVKDDALAAKVNEQKAGGTRSKVNSTPTFFLNGKQISNPQSYEQFTALIRAAISE